MSGSPQLEVRRRPRKQALSMADRYEQGDGSVFMTGLQALVRVMLDQRRADEAAGLNTAGFVSGYPGSPLATLDKEFGRAGKQLDALDVVRRLGVNEELALTAVYGSQLAVEQPGARYDGVIGMWFGKQPGLDRAHDALKHANYAGTSRHSGAVAIVGDDPAAKSSSMPNVSEVTFYDALMPVFFPGDPQDVLDLGRHAIAMSRASGLWTGLKIVSNVADGWADVEVGAEISPVLPDVTWNGEPYRHRVDGRLLPPYTVEMERALHGARMEIARRYLAENDVNRTLTASSEAWLGIVAAGKSYSDLRQALDELGLSLDDLDRHGIRLLKLGAIYPLDEGAIHRFAGGLEEILVIEDKRPFVERFVKEILYGAADAPAVVGKRDENGDVLLSELLALEVDDIATAVVRRVKSRLDLQGLDARLEEIAGGHARKVDLALPGRKPYFCSGCPHNRGAQVPEGVQVGAGVGCHGMSMWMDPEQFGDTLGLTQMGGEGAQWTGVAPFADTPHPVQNLGDGTFVHSGQLAVRAAVAAGTKMTFKLLFNDTIAMTGGQQAAGKVDVPQLVEMLALEGVERVIVTTDDLKRYRGVRLPKLATVRDRDELLDAQRELSEIDGVTVLLHDQPCAAELRRARKRGKAPEPQRRISINERVCEGCGDCAVKSNCLSLQPKDTDFGRKTIIHQASCNKDFSCLLGDCPSFVSVDISPPRKPLGRWLRGRRAGAAPAPAGQTPGAEPGPVTVALPEPELKVPEADCRIRMTGIGGTGVVTVSQVLAVAATIEGLHITGLDQIGLAQKGGPVVSDVRISREPIGGGNKVSAARSDLYLAFDVLVGLAEKNIVAASPTRTLAVANTTISAPADTVATKAALPARDEVRQALDAVTRSDDNAYVDASALSERLFGDHMPANIVLLGAAFQAGGLPVSGTAIEEAIEVNGAAVEKNLAAFRWGRAAVAAPEWVAEQLPQPATAAPALPDDLAAAVAELEVEVEDPELRRLVEIRVDELTRYQDRRYAVRYLESVARVAREAGARAPGHPEVTRQYAWSLHKLMAYKDEYEVARLHLDAALAAQVAADFPSGGTVSWHLHPPALRAVGLEKKLRLGPWARPMLVGLRAAKRLRRTPFDVFGRAHIRRVEQNLSGEFEAAVDAALAALNPDTAPLVAELCSRPDEVRGYEDVKLRTVETYRARVAEILAELGVEEPPLRVPTWPRGRA